MDEYLMHYGRGHLDGGHSGRYPWGSGADAYQRNADLLSVIEKMKKEGLSEKEIMDSLHITSSDIRDARAIAKMRKRIADEERARYLVYEKQYSKSAAARLMGINESSLRSLLDPELSEHNAVINKTADILRQQVAEKGFIDVGAGVELDDAFAGLDLKETKLKTTLAMLEDEGYRIYTIPVEQLGTGFHTNVKVLCPPGTEYKDLIKNAGNIKTITDYTDPTNTKSALNLHDPVDLDSSRIFVKYAEDGGVLKDGVIELRPGVDDLSMGAANYAQVRIAVDGTHYAKGMAIYSDDIPDGYDVVINSNKSKGTALKGPSSDTSVLKPMKTDKDNPFGATIKDQRGVLNIVNEEGDWGSWSKTISSQFLSKQDISLVKKQLNLTLSGKKDEFQSIMDISNPVLRQYYLNEFADDCDASAQHLKATGFPNQSSKVILPCTSLKDTEVYAPTYENGTKLALVRYPHAGTFEIPEVTVNNKNKEAKKIFGNMVDAIGIPLKVAQKLSGADFDGDSVTVIPLSSKVKVTSRDTLPGLKGFAEQEDILYKAYEGMPKVSAKTGFHKQREMGEVSNLITDMTLKGATDDELTRAVKHSMVVIDAEKHNLDWRKSEIENDIPGLKEKYQGGKNRGASTLISKARSEARVPERKQFAKTDPETGEKVYEETGRTYFVKKTSKDGTVTWKEQPATTTSTKMAEAKDARELSSGTLKEEVYANYANSVKSLANTARKEAISIKTEKVNETAKSTYAKEVASLNSKLNVALKYAPRERQAQIIANETVKQKQEDNPNMDFDTKKKIRNQALTGARNSLGGKKDRIVVTDSEWEAIQAGAVNKTTLEKIIQNSDKDSLKERAMPKLTTTVSDAKVSRMQAMDASGYTIAEIADACGVSTSTVSSKLKGA